MGLAGGLPAGTNPAAFSHLPVSQFPTSRGAWPCPGMPTQHIMHAPVVKDMRALRVSLTCTCMPE